MAGAAVVRPDRGYWALWLVAFSVLLVSGLAAAATGVVGQMPHVWLFSTVGFTWLTLSWTEDTRLPRPSLHLGATLAALAALGGSTAVLMAAAPADVLRTTLGIPVQAFTMAWVYRMGRRIAATPAHPPVAGVGEWRNSWVRGWVPTTAVDLALLGLAALASARARETIAARFFSSAERRGA